MFGEIEKTPTNLLRPYAIKLIDENAVVKVKPFRLGPQFNQFVEKEIEELQAKGIIEPSTSPFSSPYFVVPKKSGQGEAPKFRLVFDYRKLNENTVIEDYPIPRIEEVLDQLGDAKVFTVMDLTAGYHQIPIREEDRDKTSFTVLNVRGLTGKFRFVKMPFGSRNCVQHFQRAMNQVLDGLIGKGCYVYLDDIIVFGNTIANHNSNLNEVFKRLQKFKLKVKLEKCRFLKREIEFLGHRITPDGIGMCADKINAIRQFRIPNNPKQLSSFIGLANYYRKFVCGFGLRARILYSLLR